jgi:PPP family 3-phenylpropionic acid transporter
VATLLAPALPTARPAAKGAAPVGARLGRSFGLMLLATALVQGSHAAYYAFASLHWRANGITDAVIGLLIAEGIVAEIALFIWGRRIVERLGPAGLTALAAGSCLLRWTVTAFTVAVPVLAVVQLLHAATFACQHLSSMLVLRTLPPGRAAVAQTLVASFGFSAPTGVLIWLAGRIYADAGGLVFLVMAGIGGSALLLVRSLPGGVRAACGSARG